MYAILLVTRGRRYDDFLDYVRPRGSVGPVPLGGDVPPIYMDPGDMQVDRDSDVAEDIYARNLAGLRYLRDNPAWWNAALWWYQVSFLFSLTFLFTDRVS